MVGRIFTAIAMLAAGSFAGAQELSDASRFTGVDKKLIDAAQESMGAHPDLYFYVCTNGFGQQVLRSSRRPLVRPGGRHPDRPAPVKDIVLGSFGGRPSTTATQHLKMLCERHDTAASGGVKRPTDNKSPATGASSRPTLPPLDAEVKQRGERFSDHARRLLEIVGADYQLNGKPAHAKSTPEEVAEHAKFIASLTQSKNKQLQSAALYTCLLYVIHAAENIDLELARKVAQWSLQSGAIDLRQEFEQLIEDGRGGALDQAFGKFGQVLGAIVFTHEFRQHRLQQIRLRASGAVSALAREQMVKYADTAATGQTPRSPPIRVKVLHVAKDRTYLQISNQTGQPQRHVMIATRGIADPDYVRRAANGYRLQAKILGAFDFLPQAAAAEMPAMADVWEATQLLDVGTILYVPEMPASASIKVELCSNERLKLTEDVRVSIWSDLLVAKDVPAWNLKLVLNEVRPPSERIDKKAREAARKKTEAVQAGLAQLALNVAKDAIKRGDDARIRPLLLQAIKISPDSPAGKEAQQLLKKYQP